MLPENKRKKTETETEEKNTNDDEIWTVLVKAVLQLQQSYRAIDSTVWTVYVFPLDFPPVTMAMIAANEYASAVQDEGRGHNLGPSHVHVLMSLLECMVEDDVLTVEGDEGTKAKYEAAVQTLRTWMLQLDESTLPDPISHQMPYFGVKEAYAAKETPTAERKAILIAAFAMPGTEMENALLTMLDAHGGDRRVGKLPRAHSSASSRERLLKQ